MTATTQIFSGNAAIPFAAFSMRDCWYTDMANLVVNEMLQIKRAITFVKPELVIDLGAGLGNSTLLLLPHCEKILAVEPEEGMRQFLSLNFIGAPKVEIKNGTAENLTSVAGSNIADAIICCQTFHLLKDVLEKSIEEISKTLKPKGIFAFDLVPSNWDFTSWNCAPHRTGEPYKPDEIITEFAHPLYQRTHALVYQKIKERYPNFERTNLWPPITKSYTHNELIAVFRKYNLELVRITEILVPLTGYRVFEKICGISWSVFFRWPPFDSLPLEDKISYIESSVNELCLDNNFIDCIHLPAYCPTAVVTAVKL